MSDDGHEGYAKNDEDEEGGRGPKTMTMRP
jgi:hypothetical protein